MQGMGVSPSLGKRKPSMGSSFQIAEAPTGYAMYICENGQDRRKANCLASPTTNWEQADRPA